MSKIFLDPRVLLQKEPEIYKITAVRHYDTPFEWKLSRLPFNTVQIMGYEYWQAPYHPRPLEDIKKLVAMVRKHGRFVIGEVWCEGQEDRVTTAKRLADADVDAITVQEQYGQFGMTCEQFNEIADEARKIKSDVLMGLVEAEYQQLDVVFGHYPALGEKARCDYFGVGVFRDFETGTVEQPSNKAKINILRDRARTYGRFAFCDVDFADPAKPTYDEVAFRDNAMLAYNMLDGVVAWGVHAGGYPWRDKWYHTCETFRFFKEGNMTVPLWRNLSVPANTTAYGLNLYIPTNALTFTVYNTQSASYEFLISFDQGRTWWSLGTPISGAGWLTFQPETWRMPCPAYVTLNCTQGATDGVLSGWVHYRYRYGKV